MIPSRTKDSFHLVFHSQEKYFLKAQCQQNFHTCLQYTEPILITQTNVFFMCVLHVKVTNSIRLYGWKARHRTSPHIQA